MKRIPTPVLIAAAAAMVSTAFAAQPLRPRLKAGPTDVRHGFGSGETQAGRVVRGGNQAPPQLPPSDDTGDFFNGTPVVRQDPAVQQKLFLLPPGYTIELVL